MVSRQLELPLPDITAVPARVGIPRSQRVFVNRNLRMAGIDWVGFDMDYTLAIYEQSALDRLSMELTVRRLLERGYPEYVAGVQVQPDFAIRGLLIDKRLGHILKMDRYRIVQKGYHGLRPIPREDLRSVYQSRKMRFVGGRFHWADSLYAIAETALYATLIEALEAHGERPDYEKVFTDVRDCVDSAHRDGTLPARVLDDLPAYVRRDPRLAPALHNLRSAGKKLFLLTNSGWDYTRAMMTFLLGDAMPEYPSWRHYFDFVVVSGGKPAFFTERRPFLEIDEEADGENAPPPSKAVNHLERGRVYEGGNLVDLDRMVNVSADRVLYVGDHIYGDIVRSKKEAAWRTVLIIQELEAEMGAHDASSEDFRRLGDLNLRLNQLEDELRAHQALFKELTRQIEAAGATNAPQAAALEKNRNRVKRAVERVRGSMRTVNQETSALEHEIDRQFHPYWGSLLKEGTELSSFGDQVQAYACVYTSRVSNLLHYSPLQFFRSPRDLMPHEL